jgi:hypothetical protein
VTKASCPSEQKVGDNYSRRSARAPFHKTNDNANTNQTIRYERILSPTLSRKLKNHRQLPRKDGAPSRYCVGKKRRASPGHPALRTNKRQRTRTGKLLLVSPIEPPTATQTSLGSAFALLRSGLRRVCGPLRCGRELQACAGRSFHHVPVWRSLQLGMLAHQDAT